MEKMRSQTFPGCCQVFILLQGMEEIFMNSLCFKLNDGPSTCGSRFNI